MAKESIRVHRTFPKKTVSFQLNHDDYEGLEALMWNFGGQRNMSQFIRDMIQLMFALNGFSGPEESLREIVELANEGYDGYFDHWLEETSKLNNE